MRIDAHHHVWRLDRGDYGWLTPDLAAIHRDFGLDDLRPHLAAAGIGGTVLVQAAPTEAETQFMLAVANASGGLVRGVVGWTDLAAPDAPARIAALAAAEPLLKGLRPMLQDIAETGWILRPEVQPALRAMAAAGLRFDALVKPRHLPVLLELARAHPDLPVVIDHCAKPDIAGGMVEPWASGIARLARETAWCCKLSGLATEAAPGWTADGLRRHAGHALAEFGPDRVMWGSDWPVLDLGGGWDRWWRATEVLLAPLDAASRAAVLGGTARRFYGL
jgi:L-fuconolactonase